MFKLHFAETQVILKVLFSVKLKGTSHTKQIKNHLIFVHADLFFHFRYFFLSISPITLPMFSEVINKQMPNFKQ